MRFEILDVINGLHNLVSTTDGTKSRFDELRQVQIMVNYFAIKQILKLRTETFIFHTLTPYGFCYVK